MTARSWRAEPDNRSARELSRLTFQARESLDMWREVVESRTGKHDDQTRSLVARLDRFRAANGWNPDGFGGEFEHDLATRALGGHVLALLVLLADEGHLTPYARRVIGAAVAEHVDPAEYEGEPT